MSEPGQLIEHFFRHEYARMIASLSRRFGHRHNDLIEDAVQSAMERALASWSRRGVPDNPSAWLYRSAYHAIIDRVRRDLRWNAFEHSQHELAVSDFEISLPSETEVQDDLLRMLFICCDPTLALESQIALALKLLCGFSVAEIARALIQPEATIAKRITRAKDRLREAHFSLQELRPDDLADRLAAVQTVIYLLFNEGYQSSLPDRAVREDLCEEAVRMALLLAEHPVTAGSNASAFLALLLFHAARLDERLDSSGQLVLLEQQDRSKWDQRLLREAFRWFARATTGVHVSRYHAEAWIAAEHCRASSFANTDWPSIRKAYDLLIQIEPSPIYRLNRAIAIGQIDGPSAGLRELEAFSADETLRQYHLWHAVRGHFYQQLEEVDAARESYREAIRLAPSNAEKDLLTQKLEVLMERV